MSTPNWLIFRITTRQRFLLLLVVLVYAGTPASNSLLPPFLPEEAGPRGISITVQGWILGMVSLGQAILAPLFGKMIRRLGCRKMIIYGTLCLGVFSFLFGALTFMPRSWDNDSGTVFAVLGLFLRLISSVGAASAMVASLAVVSRCFPKERTIILTASEGIFGAGVAIGPAVGGFFYQLGGFFLPFVLMGTLLLLTALLALYAVPADEVDEEQTSMIPTQPVDMKAFLLDARSVIMFVSIIVSGLNLTTLGPILEPYVKPIGMAPYQVGILFALNMAGYTAASLLVSPFVTRVSDSRYIMMAGFGLMTVSCCVLGPSPIFNVDPAFRNVWIIIFVMPLYGAGVALSLVPTYHQFIDLLRKWNLPNSDETFGLITGLWTSFVTWGSALGSILSAFFYSRLQFQGDLAVFSLINFIMIPVLLLLILYERFGNPYWKRINDEAEVNTKVKHAYENGYSDEKQVLLPPAYEE